MLLVLTAVQNIILISPELSIAHPPKPLLHILMICRVRIAFRESPVALVVVIHSIKIRVLMLQLLKSPLLFHLGIVTHKYPPLDKSKEIDELSQNSSSNGRSLAFTFLIALGSLTILCEIITGI